MANATPAAQPWEATGALDLLDGSKHSSSTPSRPRALSSHTQPSSSARSQQARTASFGFGERPAPAASSPAEIPGSPMYSTSTSRPKKARKPRKQPATLAPVQTPARVSFGGVETSRGGHLEPIPANQRSQQSPPSTRSSAGLSASLADALAAAESAAANALAMASPKPPRRPQLGPHAPAAPGQPPARAAPGAPATTPTRSVQATPARQSTRRPSISPLTIGSPPTHAAAPPAPSSDQFRDWYAHTMTMCPAHILRYSPACTLPVRKAEESLPRRAASRKRSSKSKRRARDRHGGMEHADSAAGLPHAVWPTPGLAATEEALSKADPETSWWPLADE